MPTNPKCSKEIKTTDADRKPCMRDLGHLGPCNPFQGDEGGRLSVNAGDNYLGKLLVGRTAQGQVQFVGKCVTYTDKPTVAVRLLDDTQVTWLAELCQVVELEPAAIECLLRR